MKPMGSLVYVYKDGSADVSGVDYGPNVHVQKENDECLVLCVPGHMTWSGVGSRRYVPRKLLVYAIERESLALENGKRFINVRGLIEIDQGRKK